MIRNVSRFIADENSVYPELSVRLETIFSKESKFLPTEEEYSASPHSANTRIIIYWVQIIPDRFRGQCPVGQPFVVFGKNDHRSKKTVLPSSIDGGFDIIGLHRLNACLRSGC